MVLQRLNSLPNNGMDACPLAFIYLVVAMVGRFLVIPISSGAAYLICRVANRYHPMKDFVRSCLTVALILCLVGTLIFGLSDLYFLKESYNADCLNAAKGEELSAMSVNFWLHVGLDGISILILLVSLLITFCGCEGIMTKEIYPEPNVEGHYCA